MARLHRRLDNSNASRGRHFRIRIIPRRSRCSARPPPCRADHSRKNGRSLMKTNHEWTRINTNRPEDRWTSFNHKRHQNASAICALGVTMSWDEAQLPGFPGARASRPHNDGFLGARASRPHQAWHSLGHLPHLDQPGTAPWLSFGLADGVPAHRVAACSIALKLSGGQRDRMRAGRPRSQGNHSPLDRRSRAARRRLMRWGVGAGIDFSESRRAPFGKLPFAREPGARRAVRIIRGKTADR